MDLPVKVLKVERSGEGLAMFEPIVKIGAVQDDCEEE